MRKLETTDPVEAFRVAIDTALLGDCPCGCGNAVFGSYLVRKTDGTFFIACSYCWAPKPGKGTLVRVFKVDNHGDVWSSSPQFPGSDKLEYRNPANYGKSVTEKQP
jgi:hypothetical protein